MKPLNTYITVRIAKSEEKIGSIYVPFQKKLNMGTVTSVSRKVTGQVAVGDTIWFMEYENSTYLEDDLALIPIESVNARIPSPEGEFALQAVGSKILVRIDKAAQKKNRFKGVIGLYMPDFNNNFSFFNQHGEVLSVGSEVKEGVKEGYTAIFNQFIEGVESTLIKTLDNGDEIRVVETGTTVNFEIYGWITDRNELCASSNYVFVKESESQRELNQHGSVYAMDNKYSNGEYSIHEILVSGTQEYKTGDIVLTKGKVAPIEPLGINYLFKYLVVENLSSLTKSKDCHFSMGKLIVQ